MYTIALDIFEFNQWYRYNTKSIYKDSILDLESINGNELFEKLGFFEDEADKFIVNFDFDLITENTILPNVPFSAIRKIIPLSSKTITALERKYPDFLFGDPINQKLLEELKRARNKFWALDGAYKLLASFCISTEENHLTKFKESFLEVLTKDNNDDKNLVDCLISYERAKPFPVTDSGFFYDLGSLFKDFYNINDQDLKSINELKNIDPSKYEIIQDLLKYQTFLQNANMDKIFSNYLDKIGINDPFDQSLGLTDNSHQLVNGIIITFYFKFRQLIRDTNDLSTDEFIQSIEKYLGHDKIKKEVEVALLMNGLFFGGTKFTELYYKVNPTKIFKIKESICPDKQVISVNEINREEEIDFIIDEVFISKIKEKINTISSNKNHIKFLNNSIDELIKRNLSTKVEFLKKLEIKLKSKTYKDQNSWDTFIMEVLKLIDQG